MVSYLASFSNAPKYVGPAIISGCSVSLLAITLLHVYLLTLGIRLNQLLTFWLPLMVAGFLILFAAFSSEDSWGLLLVLAFATTLHFMLPLSHVPAPPVTGEDAIYGYQLVVRALNTGSWQFGAGTGYAGYIYSYFPMLFAFTASWAGVASIPPYLITNYAFAAVNLTAFLTLRMFLGFLGFSKRSTNLSLFMYALMPTLNGVESSFHYEAYAMIFFSLVLLYGLKSKISFAERIVALIAILAITFSHYYTAIMLAIAALILAAAYIVLRGSRVHMDLLLLPIVAMLSWNGNVAVNAFVSEVLTVRDVLGKLTSLNSYVGKVVYGPTNPSVAYYPAPWFVQLSILRNVIILGLSLLAIFSLCLSVQRRWPFRIRIVRKDMVTYLAVFCLFAFGLSFVAYYGVAWGQTLLGNVGTSGGRYVELTFIPFAIFGGAGLSVLLQKVGRVLHGKKQFLAGLIICGFIIVVFVSSAVAQGFGRSLYDSSYTQTFYDEYSSTFQEAYYLGIWWNTAANHNFTTSRPFAGSNALEVFVRSYGQQYWWETNLNSRYVALNSTFYAYYALDLAQLDKPDHLTRRTLNPGLVSSQDPHLNAVFTTGRLVILSKPSPTG